MNPINAHQSAPRNEAKEWVRKLVVPDTGILASSSQGSLASQQHLKEEKERILLSR